MKKIRSVGESLEDALHTFLTVYRSTPIHDLGGHSPAQKMLGRPMWTAALLKPSDSQRHQNLEATELQDVTERKNRKFDRGDTVYVQVHQANSWT